MRATMRTFFAWLFTIAAVVALGVGGWVAVHNWKTFGTTPADLANLGQYLSGTTAALWLLSTVFMVFATFIVQGAQFQEQRKELKETESRANAERVERTFFELLRLHHEIVNGISMWSSSRQDYFTGRRCFADMYRKFLAMAELASCDPEFRTHAFVVKLYDIFFKQYHSYLGHYFRHLYHIVKFLHESELATEDKFRLSKILRAQLSSEEQLLLFYNGLSEFGRHRFKPLIERYSLLEQIDTSQLPTIWHMRLYARAAWRDKDRQPWWEKQYLTLEPITPAREMLFSILRVGIGTRQLKGVSLRQALGIWFELGTELYNHLSGQDARNFLPAADVFKKRLKSWSKVHLTVAYYDLLNPDESSFSAVLMDATEETKISAERDRILERTRVLSRLFQNLS